MNARQLGAGEGQARWVLVFETGDDFLEQLERFAREHLLDASDFTAIGAFSEAVLGFYDWERKEYVPIPVREQAEVLSLAGTVTGGPDGTGVHAHVVLGLSDGSTRGGHLLEAHVRPTVELILSESPFHLQRKQDPATGLSLIDLSLSAPSAQ